MKVLLIPFIKVNIYTGILHSLSLVYWLGSWNQHAGSNLLHSKPLVLTKHNTQSYEPQNLCWRKNNSLTARITQLLCGVYSPPTYMSHSIYHTKLMLLSKLYSYLRSTQVCVFYVWQKWCVLPRTCFRV